MHTRQDLVAKLRELANEIEQIPESVPLDEALIDSLDETVSALDPEEPDPDETLIEGISAADLISAVEALTEAGVCSVLVHPLFWQTWQAAMRALDVPELHATVFATHVECAADGDRPHRSAIQPFRPCSPDCPNCAFLLGQWDHRHPFVLRRRRETDPGLN